MAKLIFFATLALMAVVALSAPAEEQQLYESFPDVQLEEQQEELVPQPRLPRATCDLFSAFGVADSACAAHCIAKRFRGGWCEKGVCHCRR